MTDNEKWEAIKLAHQAAVAYAGGAFPKGPDSVVLTLEKVFDKIAELKNKQV